MRHPGNGIKAADRGSPLHGIEEAPLVDTESGKTFEAVVLTHLDAAHNLARWLTRDPHDAEDVVQQACLRALKYFNGFRGSDGRAWLLSIVRNTFLTWLTQNRRDRANVEYDDDAAGLEQAEASGEAVLHGTDPEKLLQRAADQRLVEAALLQLPAEFREILVLREMEELSYKEIAEIVGVPLGTVMSRLSRARARLRTEIEAMGDR